MHDLTNPPPIPLEKSLEGRSISERNSPLLKLPLEIINNIRSQLPLNKSDLASLALVNTDCRQIARSWQFRKINLRGRGSSVKLLRLLQREALDRGQNHGLTRSLSLGVCVRRVVIMDRSLTMEFTTSKRFKPDKLINDDFDESFDYFDQSDDEAELDTFQRRARLHELEKKYDENFGPIYFVISSLIHVESLHIEDPIMNQTFLNTLAAFSIKHISMSHPTYVYTDPIMNVLEWPIESLEIVSGWDDSLQIIGVTCLQSSPTWEGTLRSCASSLQVLKLGFYADSCGDDLFDGIPEEFVSSVIEYPNLRHLDLYGLNFSASALRGIMLTTSHLTNLAINHDIPNIREFLNRECQIESLKSVILYCDIRRTFNDSPFNFLEKNMQLEGLGFNHAISFTVLERVLRLLRKFDQLKMLSMIWDESIIPKSSLEELACLTRLENLHLSVRPGNQWLICHQTMLEDIKSLRRLKRLAFSNDTYYYTVNGSSRKYNNSLRNRSQIWVIHYQHISEKALDYASAFPNLEILHTGGITYEILRVENDIRLKASDNEKFSWQDDILNFSPWVNHFSRSS